MPIPALMMMDISLIISLARAATIVAVAAVLYINFHETVILSIGDRAIHIPHHHSETRHRDRAVLCLHDMHANVGDCGIAVGAPSDEKRASPKNIHASVKMDRKKGVSY
jgi:hypothetical protein